MKVICCVLLLLSSVTSQGPVPPLPVGCLAVTGNACTSCDSANLYYINQGDGTCSQNTDLNCQAIDANGVCTTCKPGFSVSAYGICLALVNLANCAVPDPSGADACATCNYGYGIDASQRCVINVNNCQSFDQNDSTACVACDSGYTLQNNFCFRTLNQCFQYDFASQQCALCNSGYGLSTSGLLCLNTIQYCIQYTNGDSNCYECAQNTVIDADALNCTPNIVHCQDYTIDALIPTIVECLHCVSAFYVDVTKQVCVAYDNVNCEQWNPTYTICLKCAGIMIWSPQFNSCINTIDGCVAYTANSNSVINPICNHCNAGYYLDNASNMCIVYPSCPPGNTFCLATVTCTPTPYCCASYDDCGHCSTFLPNTGWCTATNQCYTQTFSCPTGSTYDCVQNVCSCPGNQKWCGAKLACVDVPLCCATDDGCGNCLSLNAGKGWCKATNACYDLSAVCPNNFDCETSTCVCPPGQYWGTSPSSGLLECIQAPACCLTSDHIGNCLTFQPFSGMCAANSQCYFYPPGCDTNNWDCVNNQCLCGANRSWCSNTHTCVDIPECCASNDNCGNCLTTKVGLFFCKSTKTCITAPNPPCVNYDCENNKCYDLPNLCPSGQTFCYSLNTCMNIPPCCETYDDCGNCLTTRPGQEYCKITESCYPTQTGCAAFDCVHQVCVDPAPCGWGQTLCPESNTCVETPLCCETFDNCGRCKTFLPFTGWCKETKMCYFNAGCQQFDCVNNICLDVIASCSPGQTFCPTSQVCVNILPCCNLWDQCGDCSQFVSGTGYCAATNQCYILPTNCPTGSYDCATGVCTCPAQQTWCVASKSCVNVPSCCATSDGCGNCLTFTPGNAWCTENNSCFAFPGGCTNYDCVKGSCRDGLNINGCDPQTYCELSQSCVDHATCCDSYDGCGNCITTVAGTGWCIATQSCYDLPASCTNYDCATGLCHDNECPSGQIWCATQNACVAIPPCCSSYDDCGNCLTFLPFTGWCAATKTCVFVFTPCSNYDCVNNVCLDLQCLPTETYCPSTDLCVVYPGCCTEYDNCGNCIKEAPGHGFCVATKTCYQKPVNCEVYDCVAGQCSKWITCPPGQVFCVVEQKCNEIPVCCLTNDDCGKCIDFLPSTGWCDSTNSCYNQPADCPYYDCEKDICSQTPFCLANQEYCSTLGKCVDVPDCCLNTDGCGNCLVFPPNKAFCSASNKCYDLIPNCLQQDCVTGVCSEFGCPTGQTMCSTTGACVPIYSCCATSTDCGLCLTFIPGTAFCSATNQCYNRPSNCLTFDCVSMTCIDNVCLPGQSLCSTNNQCIEVPSCCDTSDGCGNCITFKPGKAFCSQTSKCYDVPSGCTQWDCVNSVCIDTIQCQQNEIYCAAQNTCFPIPSCCVLADPCGNGCQTFVDNTGWCSASNSCTNIPASCPPGAWDCLGQVCTFTCPANQAYCPATQNCQPIPVACPNDYNCQTGQCNTPVCVSPQTLCSQTSLCVTPPACCVSADSCGNCLSVTNGFTQCPNDKKCYPIPPNCPLAYDQCGNCACNTGFTLCPQNNKCVPQPPNCQVFDQCGTCYVCYGGFSYINNVCTNTVISNCVTIVNNACTQCSTGYLVYQGSCVAVVTNCANQSGPNCSSCIAGFTLQNNACFQTVVQNCFSQTGLTCNQCNTGYILTQNQCWSQIQQCQNQQQNICLTCNTGYILSLNVCYVQIASCKTQAQNTCTVCLDTFALSGNACYPAIDFCGTQVQNTCSACVNGYILNLNACFAVIPNCQTQVGDQCNGCLVGYNLVNNKCAFTSVIANCQQVLNAKCALCNPGFYVDVSSGQCYPKFCSSYNVNSQTCSACSLTAVLNNGVCYNIEQCKTYNFNTSPVTCSACNGVFVLKNSGQACLGPAHFIIKSDLTLSSKPLVGYSGANSQNGFSLNWGSFTLGVPGGIWYLTKYSATGLYTVKVLTTSNSIVTQYYLAYNGSAPYLTDNFVGDARTFWSLSVQNVNSVNLWSFASAVDGSFLAEGVVNSSNQVFFNLV